MSPKPIIGCLLASALAACGRADALGESDVRSVVERTAATVEWRDDFLGSALRRQYTVHRATPVVPENRLGGWVRMKTRDHPSGEYWSGRFRLGDDPRDTAQVPLNMPFSHDANAVGRTRVIMDSDDYVHATIGFVGPDDPNGVSGALIYRHDRPSEPRKTWLLQACDQGQCSGDDLEWVHEPGVPFEVEIRLSPGRVEAWIDGELKGALTEFVPQGEAAWEYQMWGYADGAGVQTEPSMLIDYLVITQDRL